jgi:hypothetical protein
MQDAQTRQDMDGKNVMPIAANSKQSDLSVSEKMGR